MPLEQTYICTEVNIFGSFYINKLILFVSMRFVEPTSQVKLNLWLVNNVVLNLCFILWYEKIGIKFG
jgi:hypothetical protein